MPSPAPIGLTFDSLALAECPATSQVNGDGNSADGYGRTAAGTSYCAPHVPCPASASTVPAVRAGTRPSRSPQPPAPAHLR
jgi:hypothetical protein